jgi:hypothetical protein
VSKHVLLSSTEHRDLRIDTTCAARLGDDVMAIMTFPAEFRSIQAHYPIVFARMQDGSFTPLALFGFREKQNVFLTSAGWDASYVPMMIERAPFFIGNANNGQVIHVDIESPRVSRAAGERLFDDAGAGTAYLEHVGSLLATINDGIAATAPFTAALVEHNLLEPFVLDIELRGGEPQRFTGFHTIREEKLAPLDGNALAKLHERGFLQAIYMVIASLSQFRVLIDRANRGLSGSSG